MLFKVLPPDSSSKKMIKGDSIDEIISTAKFKFNLYGDNYKLALMDDNTEIEEDEILIEYVEQYKNKSSEPITLLLLSDEHSYPNEQLHQEHVPQESESENVRQEQNRPSTSNGSTHLGVSRNVPSSISRDVAAYDLNTHVWSKAPDRLITCCEQKRVAEPKDRRTFISLVADYIVNELKDTSRKTARVISEKIQAKYPDTFSDKVGDQIYGKGSESLFLQLYNAIMYRKSDKDATKRKVLERDSDDEDEEIRQQEKKHFLKQDEYGCVDYCPQLSDGETIQTQEEKRLLLIDMFSNLDRDDSKISRLMNETYPTQRACVNAKDRDIAVVTTDWPFLKDEEFLILHFNRLVGKNAKNTFASFRETKLKALRQYLKTYKFKGEKKAAAAEIVRECKEACASSRSDVPKTLIVFRLLVLYFNEKEDYFFKIVNIDVPDENIANEAHCDNPVLLVRGHSLYDDNSTCTVILEKKIIIFCKDVLQGFIVLFASYFIYGYSYSPEVEKTLEYMQREIMKMNPTAGSKRGNKRRKATTYNAAVFKLAKEIAEFQNA